MIRIDLGKDELQKPSKRSKAINLSRLKLGNLANFRKLSTDLGSLAMIGAVVGAPVMAHLFFGQFKSYLTKTHESQMQALQQRTDEINGEIARLQPFRSELKSYEEQKRLVRERLEVVRELLSSRGTPVNVLDALGQSLPPRAWLQSLTMNLLTSKGDLRMSGSAYSNEDISDFIDKLSESVHFTDVALDDVGNGKVDAKYEVRSFSVHAKPKVLFPSLAKKAPAGIPPAAIPPTAVTPPAGVTGDSAERGTAGQ